MLCFGVPSLFTCYVIMNLLKLWRDFDLATKNVVSLRTQCVPFGDTIIENPLHGFYCMHNA